jgi:hypothetical protein
VRGLDRPKPVDRHTPLGRATDTRDRTCRLPGCAQRGGWADDDHLMPHACGGVTDCADR